MVLLGFSINTGASRRMHIPSTSITALTVPCISYQARDVCLCLISRVPSAPTRLWALAHVFPPCLTHSFPCLFGSYTSLSFKFCGVFARSPCFRFPLSDLEAPCSVLPHFCLSAFHTVLTCCSHFSLLLDCESPEGKGERLVLVVLDPAQKRWMVQRKKVYIF